MAGAEPQVSRFGTCHFFEPVVIRAVCTQACRRVKKKRPMQDGIPYLHRPCVGLAAFWLALLRSARQAQPHRR